MGVMVVKREEDEEEEILCLFRNCISVDIFIVHLDYGPRIDNDDIGEKSIMQLTDLDASVRTLLTRLEQS